ncbi:hypothetical protein HF998_00635 [Cellulomonas hominis]|uniref:Uncharacterized protein n=1 Tax=Cellulomonas hominis TaxID=156981 RepID=A0A7W8SIA3_9CELL|nr:hypothetical protein [Cellulomonas hominis]MBB5474657.1 hypothetical protein [Cellulomonas hominis]NKY05514.1 hypothetical protein [Cellulomonas hominis]
MDEEPRDDGPGGRNRASSAPRLVELIRSVSALKTAAVQEINATTILVGATAVIDVDARLRAAFARETLRAAQRAGATDLLITVWTEDDDDLEVAELVGMETLHEAERAGLAWRENSVFLVHAKSWRSRGAGELEALTSHLRMLSDLHRPIKVTADVALLAIEAEMSESLTDAPAGERPVLCHPGHDSHRGPAFQFDLASGRVHPVVRELAGTLRYAEDPVGSYSWWTRRNSWIAATPAELLGTGQDDLIRFAAAQIREDAW